MRVCWICDDWIFKEVGNVELFIINLYLIVVIGELIYLVIRIFIFVVF